jgi:uncharacterized protein DUF839
MRLPLALAVMAVVGVTAGQSRADDDDGVGKVRIGVPNAVTPVPNTAQPSLIDPEYAVRLIATGTDPLENPSGLITMFGKLATGANTEPDENTYLKLGHNPGGPTPGFNYGRNFLFQGHENAGNQAYVTRINLDVQDPAHRITLLTPGVAGITGFNRIDGSTYNPFTQTLLFTQENGNAGGVIQITRDWPAQVNTLYQFLGRGGYEGIHPDDKGNLYIAEDVGGVRPGGLATIDGAPNTPLRAAAQPNSFIYRYVPNNPRRIEDGGKLQALQVIINGSPVVFHAADPTGDIIAPAQRQLHTLGTSWPAKWVTIHTANKDDPPSASFDANAAAKAAGATPFKRPENIAWLPGSDFRTFYFTPTGDTDAPTGQVPQLAARGAWGSIFRIDLDDDDHHGRDDRHGRGHDDDDDHGGVRRTSDSAKISIFVLGDQVHNSFDNIAFINGNQLLAAEDRGDTLHDQLATLDSVWAFDTRVLNGRPLRFVAVGRDASASAPGEEDNEPTGVFVSSGGPKKSGLLGTEKSLDDARGFITIQHGDNNLYEFFNVRPGHP